MEVFSTKTRSNFDTKVDFRHLPLFLVLSAVAQIFQIFQNFDLKMKMEIKNSTSTKEPPIIEKQLREIQSESIRQSNLLTRPNSSVVQGVPANGFIVLVSCHWNLSFY